MNYYRKIFSASALNDDSSKSANQNNCEKARKATKFWTSRPLYWVHILRWTYAVGLSPVQVMHDEDAFVVVTCKLRKGLQLGVLLLYIAFLASSFRHALTCENYFTPMARLLVHLGDIAKVMALMHVTWYKIESIQQVLNNFLFHRSSMATPADRKEVSLFRKAWIWTIVLGYPLQSFGVFVLVQFGLGSSSGFASLLDPFYTCHSSTNSALDEVSIVEYGYHLLWRIIFALKHMYVVLTDAYLLATIGAYSECVSDFISSVEKFNKEDNDKIRAKNTIPNCNCAVGVFTKSEPFETENRFFQERMLGYIQDFQSTIRNMNDAMGTLAAVWFFTNLPYHVFKGIPLESALNEGTFVSLITRAYTIQFYLGLAIAAYNATKVTNAVRSWISKAKRSETDKQPELQLLFMEANVFHDFALNLNGLGCINSTLFLSTLSVTVTYTLVNYQFSLYKNV